ncbi:hypothetical protein FXO38_21797 [Capsicum annuum]|nr:hypothetical protein FXO38_21797 [Capsicum annuum]KAF3664969.1 hypothetical protein FXO37_11241 [Capsicum annuum]
MSLMGELTFILGLQIKQTPKGTFISQSKYTKELIKKFGMDKGKAFGNPMSPLPNLDSDTSEKDIDEKMYRDLLNNESTRHYVQFSATYDSKTFSSMGCVLDEGEWCKKESVKAKFDLLRVGKIISNSSSAVFKDIEEDKELLRGLEKGTVNLQEFVAKLVQLEKATITEIIAVGFTLQGGFDSNPDPNQGMAILTRQAVFKAFIITDVIAFVCSAGAVFSYFAMAANAAFFPELRAVQRLYVIATGLQHLALAALVQEFVTGIYAALVHSTDLEITVSAIGCFSFLIYFYMLSMPLDWKCL